MTIRSLFLFCLLALTGCGLDYDPVRFTVEGGAIVARGAIDDTTQAAFEQVAAENPQIKTLVLAYVEGSVDDEANLIFGRVVREMGFETRVPSNGLVASGGTDLFLAGATRVLDPGACVGVHSWGWDSGGGADLPRSHPQHQSYLNYYRDLGIDPEFYWYTLDAAPTDGMHWMTAGEAVSYGMATRRTPDLGTSADCQVR